MTDTQRVFLIENNTIIILYKIKLMFNISFTFIIKQIIFHTIFYPDLDRLKVLYESVCANK